MRLPALRLRISAGLGAKRAPKNLADSADRVRATDLVAEKGITFTVVTKVFGAAMERVCVTSVGDAFMEAHRVFGSRVGQGLGDGGFHSSSLGTEAMAWVPWCSCAFGRRQRRYG